jgi:hypothetical protein
MERIQTQMAAQTQARNEAWVLQPMPGALFSAPIQEPFRANAGAQTKIQGRLHEVGGVQGRANERQSKTAEVLKRAAEAVRLAREAKKRTVDGQKHSLPRENKWAIEVLRPLSNSMQEKPGDALILFWDWQEGGVVGERASVGHVATAVISKGEWIIVHSQFPHSNGGTSAPTGPNTTIAIPGDLFNEEGRRKPNSAYLVTIPNFGAFAKHMMVDLEKPLWETNPGSQGSSTNCTYGTIHALRAGGVPLSAMWSNQTLIIPMAPYLPRDLRTALKREAPFNVIHKFSIHQKNELIDKFKWEEQAHE